MSGSIENVVQGLDIEKANEYIAKFIVSLYMLISVFAPESCADAERIKKYIYINVKYLKSKKFNIFEDTEAAIMSIIELLDRIINTTKE